MNGTRHRSSGAGSLSCPSFLSYRTGAPRKPGCFLPASPRPPAAALYSPRLVAAVLSACYLFAFSFWQTLIYPLILSATHFWSSSDPCVLLLCSLSSGITLASQLTFYVSFTPVPTRREIEGGPHHHTWATQQASRGASACLTELLRG